MQSSHVRTLRNRNGPEELRKPQMSLRQRLHVQKIQDKEDELRGKKLELAGEIVVIADLLDGRIGDFSTRFHEARRRVATETPVDKLVASYAMYTGKSPKRNPLCKATIQLQAELEQLKTLPLPLDDQQNAETPSANRLSKAEREYADLRARHDALERIGALLSTRATSALQACSDPLSDSDVADIRRFLDTAGKAVAAPSYALPEIESRLHDMRLP